MYLCCPGTTSFPAVFAGQTIQLCTKNKVAVVVVHGQHYKPI